MQFLEFLRKSGIENLTGDQDSELVAAKPRDKYIRPPGQYFFGRIAQSVVANCVAILVVELFGPVEVHTG